MNCPNCGTFNQEGSRFCLKCGSSLLNSSSDNSVNVTSFNQNLNQQNNVANTNVQYSNGSTIQTNSASSYYSQNDAQPLNDVNLGETNNNINNAKKPKKTKLILIIIALLAVGVLFFFFMKNQKTRKDIAEINDIFDPNKPIVVSNNKKYGYITSEGEMMIDLQYNSASVFYGDYAIVTVDNPNADSYIKNLYQIIDKKGNVILSVEGYTEPKYYKEYEVWVIDNVLYDSKLNKILSDGITVDYESDGYFEYVDKVKNECGILNYKGKIIFTDSCNYINAEISTNKYNQDDLYAAVTIYSEPRREFVVSLKTGDVLFRVEDAENYYLFDEYNGIFRYYNYTETDGYSNRKYLFFINNKLAYQTTEKVDELRVYDYENQILEIDYGYSYSVYTNSTKRYDYYDVKNNKMLEKAPSKSSDTEDEKINLEEQNYGFKKFYSNGSYGLMKGDKVVVPCEYDSIELLNINLFNYMKSKGKELVLLEKNKKYKLYDVKNSKEIIEFNSKYLYDYDDSTFIKFNLYEENSYTTAGYIVYNLLSGKLMEFSKDDGVSIYSNYITLLKDDKKIYYNVNFKQIYESNKN